MSSRLPAALLSLALAACADLTALDLSLVPDPNVQSEAALVSRLARIRLVVDAAEGLYPGGPGRSEGDLELADLDGDGARELLARIELGGLGRLPRIRVERGDLPGGTAGLELRLDGVGPDDSDGKAQPDAELAAGGVQGISFSEGSVAPVQIPFNLRARFRPPRVTQVFPEEGAVLPPGKVLSVLCIFSKPMTPSSLKPGVIQVLQVAGGDETPVGLKEIAVGELYAGGPTRADIRFLEALKTGSYRVRVGQGALDTSGRPLDQVPMAAGNQPFAGQFSIQGAEATTTTCPVGSCGPLPCADGGSICPAGSSCDTATRTCLPESCPKVCAGGVCDPARVACVEDCRPYGSYGGCAAGAHCDPQTGLCR